MLHVALGNLIYAGGWLLNTVLYAYILVLFARALFSWVQPHPCNPLVLLLAALTDPVLVRVRRRFPMLVQGGMDFTPMAVFFLLFLLNTFVVRFIMGAGLALAVRGF